LLLSALIVLPILACGPPQDVTEEGRPTITIVSPVSGVTVTPGQQVLIQSSASDEDGIARVELLVNSVVVRVDPPAEGTPTTFAIAQPWTPQAAGDYVVHVIAYDTQDQASLPASVAVRVVEAAGQVTATATAAATAISPTDTPVPDVTQESGCTLNASFAADVTIPDQSEIQPGVSFVKTWRIRNSGTCDWSGAFQLVFVNGDRLGAPSAVSVPLTTAGSTADVSVTMSAPAEPGTYRSNWRVQSDEGVIFGSEVYVLIVVPSPATATPTLTTATPTPSVTPKPTSTGTPPAAPTGLSMSVSADGYVSFTWVDNASDEEGYYVLAAGEIEVTLGADSEAWGFQEGDYFCEQTVQVTVVAYKGDIRSALSNAVTYTGSTCPPQALTEVTRLTMGLSTYLDLDAGGLSDYDAAVDLEWQSSGGYYIAGVNGMQFANLGVGTGVPGYASCSAVEKNLGTLYTPDLQAGTRLCVETTEGNLAGLRVEEIKSDYNLVVSFVTWQETQ
jgi:hypothetical protein